MPFVEQKNMHWLLGRLFCVMMQFLWVIPIKIGNFTVYSLSVIAGFLVLYALEKNRIMQKIFLAVTFFSVRWIMMVIGNCIYIWITKICVELPHFSENLGLQFQLFLLLLSMSGLIGYAMMKYYDYNYRVDTNYKLSEISMQFNLLCFCYYVISLITIIVLIVLYQSIKEKQEEAKAERSC